MKKIGAAVLLLVGTWAGGQGDQFYGEPVLLKSHFIYFTSWKYVRQGSFAWQPDYPPDTTEEEKQSNAWLQGDAAMNHEGKAVILRFQLRQARLFGIEFY